jgi:hypothetical protein
MAVVARQAVSVGTSAVRLDADPTDNASGDRLILIAQGAGTVVLGRSGVAAGTGCRIPVVAGTMIPMDLDQGESLYGIVASGTILFDVLMLGA